MALTNDCIALLHGVGLDPVLKAHEQVAEGIQLLWWKGTHQRRGMSHARRSDIVQFLGLKLRLFRSRRS